MTSIPSQLPHYPNCNASWLNIVHLCIPHGDIHSLLRIHKRLTGCINKGGGHHNVPIPINFQQSG